MPNGPNGGMSFVMGVRNPCTLYRLFTSAVASLYGGGRCDCHICYVCGGRKLTIEMGRPYVTNSGNHIFDTCYVYVYSCVHVFPSWGEGHHWLFTFLCANLLFRRVVEHNCSLHWCATWIIARESLARTVWNAKWSIAYVFSLWGRSLGGSAGRVSGGIQEVVRRGSVGSGRGGFRGDGGAPLRSEVDRRFWAGLKKARSEMDHILWTETDRICIILLHTLDPCYGQFLTTDFCSPASAFCSPAPPTSVHLIILWTLPWELSWAFWRSYLLRCLWALSVESCWTSSALVEAPLKLFWLAGLCKLRCVCMFLYVGTCWYLHLCIWLI